MNTFLICVVALWMIDQSGIIGALCIVAAAGVLWLVITAPIASITIVVLGGIGFCVAWLVLAAVRWCRRMVRAAPAARVRVEPSITTP